MEAPLERQAIRLAITLAAASTHGATAEVIADVREAAAHLVTLCVRSIGSPDELVRWCDDTIALIERAVIAGSLDDEHALPVTANILRFRLLATQQLVQRDAQVPKKSPASQVADATDVAAKPKPKTLSPNARKVYEYIRSNPEVRTMALIENFSTIFSARSTKRYLAELLEKNFVERQQLDDGGMAYRVLS